MTSNRQRTVSRKLQRGVSNIQIMIGVLIGGIMIMAGVQMIRMVDQAKIDGDLRDLTDYKKKVVILGAQIGSFGVTQNAAYLSTMGFFDQSIVSGSPVVISNRWGGEITARATQWITTPSADAYNFTYTGIPSSACKQLATQAANIVDGIMVGTVYVKKTPATGGTGLTDEALAISTCDSGKDKVTMVFTISKY